MSQCQHLFLWQVILIFSIIQFKPARYENYIFPPWAQGVGWVIALASIIWIPLGTIHTLWVLPGSLMQVRYIVYYLADYAEDTCKNHLSVIPCQVRI